MITTATEEARRFNAEVAHLFFSTIYHGMQERFLQLGTLLLDFLKGIGMVTTILGFVFLVLTNFSSFVSCFFSSLSDSNFCHMGRKSHLSKLVILGF